MKQIQQQKIDGIMNWMTNSYMKDFQNYEIKGKKQNYSGHRIQET
jgi:hypothetical protein